MSKIEPILDEALLKLQNAGLNDIETIRIEYLGKKGKITEMLKNLSELSIEEKKQFGAEINTAKTKLNEAVENKKKEITARLLEEKMKNEKIDISPAFAFPFSKGHKHIITKTIREMTDIFVSLGFDVAEGKEIETDWYNFEALNIPKDHPARDTQDTFYLEGSQNLLRTHTSPAQIHIMEQTKPPIRVVVPGRVYRNEATDATHSATFHQIEGLVVGEDITFAELKGTLSLFIHRLFGQEIDLRFRPSHFQFTEPSAEVDIKCVICGGKGCRVCKQSGWLEVLGCGMVHPNVFKSVNYDSEKYTGYAFGMGVERFAMFKNGIDDMRVLYENDIRVLKQF
ncbi:MAG: phenylalanine--tRNA ligase subunit alpha [Endomicrobiaceae bacterium]|jgi:phenylalanyl-tRNA synthetase alpha chain|nr:phenylalanine--tRNA ligase subunit alpha [Endomicrobiaceae bacterium]MDD3729812.1 phenylalanine--tRNA ligase subunit alpha [Endomicrobiaceae bacterium]MDD4166174.1 phenylalanine--tRNA ligase subunit alpha [Endomicrobiaceae bacterium]